MSINVTEQDSIFFNDTEISYLYIDDVLVYSKIYLVLPIIVSQPESPPDTYVGTEFVITVGVSEQEGEILEIQWYEGLVGDVTTPVGSDSLEYTGVKEVVGSYRYWALLTNQVGSVATDLCVVNVVPLSIEEVYIVEGDVTIPFNEEQILTAEVIQPEPLPISYLWYKGTTPISGSDSKTYTVPPSSSNVNATEEYKVRATTENGSMTSNPIYLNRVFVKYVVTCIASYSEFSVANLSYYYKGVAQLVDDYILPESSASGSLWMGGRLITLDESSGFALFNEDSTIVNDYKPYLYFAVEDVTEPLSGRIIIEPETSKGVSILPVVLNNNGDFVRQEGDSGYMLVFGQEDDGKTFEIYWEED